MQQRRGTASQWISTNSGNGPILAAGEIGFESDTNKFKIGDGINHWVDLTYFTDAESAISGITDLIDGAPAALNTLNELAAALGDDPAFITTVATNLSNHQSDTTNIHGIANTADLATQEYVDNIVSNSEANLSTLAGNGLAWNATDSQLEIDSIVATTDYVDTELGTHNSATTSVHGIANTADLATVTEINSAVSTHSSDTTSVHGISDTSELATKTFAAELLTGATKTNISITGDKNGLTITAENGVSDSTTDNLAEGTNNKYFTDERAQDAVGNAVGTGLTYTDATGEIAVNTSVMQERVANVSDTEIGYLNGVTSLIQTQLDAKSTDLSSHASDTTSIHGIADTSALALTADVNSALDLKADLSSPTFTGIVTVNDIEIGGDLTFSGTATQINQTDLTLEDPIIYLAEGNTANINDIGFVGAMDNGTYQHVGLVRDASDNAWKFFKGVTDEPTSTVNFGQGSLDDLKIAGLTATSITVGDVSNTEFGYLNGVTSAIQTQLDSKVSSLATANSQTSSYTIVLSDKDKVVEMNIGSANTITVSPDSTSDFPIGTQIDILQVGSGQTTVVAGSGVTINATPGLKLRTQWAGATLRKRAANTWVLVGDLTS